MKILVQFPTYKRQEKFVESFKKYLSNSSGQHEIHFNVNCDLSDLEMNNIYFQHEFENLVSYFKHVTYSLNYDANTNKISAINSHIEGLDFDIVICASDDMIPQVFKWDEEICNAMNKFFPDLDGCVHFNDGYTNGKLITFSILGRKLYEHFGYIYHPDYKSLYCDNEFTEEVTRLNKVQYVDEVIVKHEHYAEKDNSNSGDFDEAAKKTLHYSGRDQAVFNERKKRGFPKEKITND